MRIVLRSDVDGVGKKGDVMDVADGFARNYLIPQGLGFRATEGTERQAAAMRRTRELRDAHERSTAEEIATRVVATPITIAARSGEGGRLFGSVTTADIVTALREQVHVEIDRRVLALDEPIKQLGTHVVMAKLHADVEFPVTVEVIGD